MKSRNINGFAFFILFCILIILSKLLDIDKTADVEDEAEAAWNTVRSLELMAIMENEMAKEESDSGQTSKEVPDYTKMFSDLYTVILDPKEPEEGKEKAYLTFDDGPSDNTFKVLDILEEYNVKATFFIVGKEITEEREESLKRMVYEGHTIGIHTYSHMCKEIYCSVERYLEDFNKVYQQIYDITGKRVNIYRFPWGSNNKYGRNIKDALIEEMNRRGFTCYDWNVSAEDSIGHPTRYSIKRNILKDLDIREDPIILMHDSRINDLTVDMLPEIIKMISEKGYEFDTLDNREPYQFPW